MVLAPLLAMGAYGLYALRDRKVASAAEREAAVFHQRLSDAQYEVIYETAAPSFRVALKRTDSAKYFAAIHDKMGACKMPTGALAYITNTSKSPTRVQLRYRLQCANGDLEETMLYEVTSDGPRLAGYDANSPSLVIR